MKENWFKIGILLLGVSALWYLYGYQDRELWRDVQMEVFSQCADKVTDDPDILLLNDTFKQDFRNCFNLSKNF